jgi:hypothetical protein
MLQLCNTFNSESKMDRDHILNKIKLLMRLSGSPNSHEADSARQLAEKLVAKYNVTPEELESLKDPKELYSDEEKLYGTLGLISWRQQLALVIGTYFDCQVVQVETVPNDGPHYFDYYVYGDPQDAQTVHFVFHAFASKVEWLITTECMGRGPIYTDSYSEGVTDSIKQNIWAFGIELPEKKVQARPVGPAITVKSEEIVKPKEDKVRAEKRVDVRSQSMVKDIMAYFKGIDDGRDLSLKDVLEMAEQNEEAGRVQETTEEASEHPAQPGPTEAIEGQDD